MVFSTVAIAERSTTANCIKGKPRSVVLSTLDAVDLSCSYFDVGDGAEWTLKDFETELISYTLTFTDFCLDNGGKFTLLWCRTNSVSSLTMAGEYCGTLDLPHIGTHQSRREYRIPSDLWPYPFFVCQMEPDPNDSILADSRYIE